MKCMIYSCVKYTLKHPTDFQSLITKLVDMIQATKDQEAKGRAQRDTLYMSEAVSLEIHLKHGHRCMCAIGVSEMSDDT